MTDPVDELLARGKAAWPQLPIAEPLARAHFEAKVEAAGPAAADLCAEDLYLAIACVHGVARALAAFDAQYLGQVRVFVARMRPSTTIIDEVQQQLRVRLLTAAPGEMPKIAEYGGRGSLTAWVRVAAIRAAIDLLRKSDVALDEPDPDGEPLFDQLRGDDVELGSLRERYLPDVNDALREAWRGLSDDERMLLRLNYRDGRSIDEIGALLRVHRSTVARRIADARAAVLTRARALLQAKLQLGADDLDSLIRAMRSQLHLSLSRIAPNES